MFKFLRVIGAMAVLAAVVFIATAMVNPYGVWPQIPDFLTKHTERINSVRLVKSYDLYRSCPDHVITGMSTVVWGIDPELYPVEDKVLYNGGIVGSSMIEQYDYIMRYLALCPNISRVYLDVKLESFENLRINAKDFLASRVQQAAILPNDVLFTNFSKSAVAASWATISHHLDGTIDQRVYDTGDGFHHLIETTDSTIYLNNFRNFIASAASNDNYVSNLQLSHFRALVAELKRRNIEVVVYFGPMHMLLQYQMTVLGYHPEDPDEPFDHLEQLKREVAKVTDFYDFTVYGPLIDEDIADTKMFIDQIHYRPRLGAMIMAAINGQRDGLPEGFGQLVTEANLEANLAEARAGVAKWAAAFPNYKKEVDDHVTVAVRGSIPELADNW
jgi:hypothetical protein